MKIREWGRLGEGEVYLKGVYQSGHSLLFHSPPALSPHFLATIVLSFSNVKQILSSPGLLSFMIPHVCCGESRLSSGPSLVPCFPSSGHTAALLNPQMPSWLRAFEHLPKACFPSCFAHLQMAQRVKSWPPGVEEWLHQHSAWLLLL